MLLSVVASSKRKIGSNQTEKCRLLLPTGDGVRVRRKARLVIDVDQVLGVPLADETEPFSVEI